VSTQLAGDFSRTGISGPVAAAQGEAAVWCVAEGRLEGVAGLAAELGIDPSAPSEAVLAAAFADRKEAMLEPLGGPFALFAWNGSNDTGLLAVDQLGSQSIFFHEGGGTCLSFATEVVDLLRLLDDEPGPDESAVARWIVSGTLEPDETLFEGVRRLPGGCHLRFAAGRWTEHRHWRPQFTNPMSVTLEEAGATVRAALERSLAEQCAGRSIGVLLSGGLDSTSVAAVTAASGCSTALRAYSALFPGDAAADESEFVELAVTGLDLPTSRHGSQAAGVLSASAEHVREWRLPAASPNLFFQRPLLERAKADGAEIILDGQGGDELFGCSPYLLGDLVRGLRLRSLNTRARELAGGDPRAARGLLRTYALGGAAPGWLRSAHSRLRKQSALHWLTPRGAELVGESPGAPAWLALEGPRWWAWLADTLTAGRERMGVHDHLRRKLASEQLAGAHPLLDDLRLIELVLRLPPELAYDRELDRPVLRRAMRGLVPEPIRLRPTKSVFNTLVVDSLSGPDRPLLRRLLEPRRAEIRAYVTDNRLRDVVDGPIARDHPHLWAQNAWRLASTELWLQSLASEQEAAARSDETVSA
jgi:asparagine synthase (glutamine-hydrolysing)